MHLRTPTPPCPEWQSPPQQNTRRFRVTLITPMYGGGVKAGEPDADMPIRASAIRGQLRFWWRLLNREKYPESRDMFRAEREVWGGLGKSEKEVTASKVLLRIADQPDKNQLVASKNVIPQYAIAVSRTGKTDLPNVLNANTIFELIVTCDPDIWVSVHTTLRWWSSFGGLGARTRRGLGAVEVDGLKPVNADEVKVMGCNLALNGDHSQPIEAWQAAIDKLSNFRQGAGIARRPALPGSKAPTGRSYWPEPDAIRRITDTHRIKSDQAGGHEFTPAHPAGNVFPRAFFGLPIIFHFKSIVSNKTDKGGKIKEDKDKRFDPYDVRLRPARANSDRMASPLIVRPYRLTNGHYAAAALCLPIDHMNDLTLQIENVKQPGNHKLKTPIKLRRTEWWPLDSQQAETLAKKVSPLDKRSPAPLDAFLHYFEKG